MVFGSGLSLHGFVVKEDENIYCFGNNSHFQLGLGDKRSRKKLTIVDFFTSITGKDKIIKIVTGYEHTIWFFEKNQLFTAGSNKSGCLCLDDFRKVHKIPTALKITVNKNVLDVLDLFCGHEHVIVLSKLLECYSFGYNSGGQLGDKGKTRGFAKKINFTEKIISVSCGGSYSLFLSINGNLYCCGDNYHGQLGEYGSCELVRTPKKLSFSKEKKILQICCGEWHTLFLCSDNRVYATGNNENGNLGVSRLVVDECTKTPLLVEFLKDEKILSLNCGGYHSQFRSKKKMWLCGYNLCGQIGNYNLGDQFIPILFSISGKKIIQSLLLDSSSIFFCSNEVFGCGENMNGELFCNKVGDSLTKEETWINLFKIMDLNVKKYNNYNRKSKKLFFERFGFLTTQHNTFEICL